MSGLYRLQRIGDDFISLLFPRLCQSCGDHLVRNENIICLSCLADLPMTGHHNECNNNLEKELWGRCYVERAAAMCFFRRGSKVQKLMHRFKYYGVRKIGLYLGELYGNQLSGSPFLDSIDVIVPVPLHPAKERKRGFNQSKIISEGISSATKIPMLDNVLYRKKVSLSQTRKSRVERWENVEGIFSLSGSEEIINRHVLLVDDVITTGSTIEACVYELKKAEGVRVSVAAIGTAVQ